MFSLLLWHAFFQLLFCSLSLLCLWVHLLDVASGMTDDFCPVDVEASLGVNQTRPIHGRPQDVVPHVTFSYSTVENAWNWDRVRFAWSFWTSDFVRAFESQKSRPLSSANQLISYQLADSIYPGCHHVFVTCVCVLLIKWFWNLLGWVWLLHHIAGFHSHWPREEEAAC